MSSIMKGIVDETPAKKGADGKRCWKGKRYAGTENGKDKCIPVKNEAANPAQQAAIAINMKKQGKKPKNVDEASGTPGGVEMFRTKDMVDLAMQQNLYKRDLEKLKKAKQAEKPKPAYRKPEPVTPGEEQSIHIASTAIPTALVKDWMENKSVPAVVDFIASRYAHRQSTKMIDEIKADPKFVDAVSKFFDIAGKSLELRSKVKAAKTTVNDSRFRVEAEDLRLSGFAAFREITNVIVDYMKKYGVDKTGRRVPPGFNYNLEEGVIVGHDAQDPEVAILGGAGTMSLSRLKKKAHGEALQLADDISNGKYSASSYNMKQLHNTLNTIVAAEKEMEKLYFGESLDENAWNQLGQRKPNTNLPAPDRGSRVNHGRRFEEGDIVIPLSGPLKGQPHKVIHSQRSSIRIVPLGRDSYPGDTIAPRTKHEWVVPASEEQVAQARANAKAFADKVNNFNEDYTGEYAAEKTAAVNPYGGLKDRQFRGAISETPTDNPTGASGEGGWRTYKPKSAGEIEEGQIYSTGGGCGQSYRKFTPKSAGTFKESAIMSGIKRESL